MAIIKKKIWPQYYDEVASGKKKFELRLADFEIKEGDTFILAEWDPQSKAYTGRELVKKAGAVYKFKKEDLFNQAEAMMENGFYVITLE